MAETSIEWTERTWNPIVGCSIVSPGCTNCYAMGMADRFKHVYRGRKWAGAAAQGMTRRVNGKAIWTGQLTLAPDHILTEPLRRKRPTTYFVNSMGDLFHEDTPEDWIDRVFAVMALTPHHTYQVLTKRGARMREYMLEQWQGTPARTVSLGHGETLSIPAGGPTGRRVRVEEACERYLEQFGLVDTTKDHLWTEEGNCKAMQWQWPLPNVWLGVSTEDQKRADERIPELLATPAAVRFVSAEPLLGPIDFRDITIPQEVGTWQVNALECDCPAEEDTELGGAKLDWIIVGGESGPGARPMHPDWPRQIRDQCAAAGTAFFFKQWGNWFPLVDRDKDDPDWRLDYSRRYSDDRPNIAWLNAAGGRGFHGERFHIMGRGMKATAGRFLDGGEHNAMPKGRA
ncbi:hypothetical protein ASE61_14910 [Bosea sp. Root670]|uniref:phage Gp37/Gp68 family protein n=1 Tax=Bosea sp. Root670 TaxID=1736583 RepID=UPI0007126B74|nr:phage Gp37/Gp68 family protein [Bosea sp. Root670]KRE02568.1 hypothetical protein ASE61_14910 [Bosea sp. Root670]